MTIQLEDTGERMIPEHHKGKNIYGAHIARYQAGLPLAKNKVVLDVACGSGYGAKLISKIARKVIGVDIDGKTIEYAKKNYHAANISYKVGSATEIPLGDNSVDTVISYETIEHIDDYNKFLTEVKRVLKPEGQLLISTPNEDEYTHKNEFHIHEFRYKQIKGVINKYFKYHKDYFQTHWVYSSILPSELQASEWTKKIQTVNTAPTPPEQCIFFYILCSDKPLNNDIEPIGVISEHYRLRDLQEANREVQKTLNEMRMKLNTASTQSQHLRVELSAIKRSKSWKVAIAISKTVAIIKRPLYLLRRK